MLLATKGYIDQYGDPMVLIFEDNTGRQVDFDFEGTPQDVLARAGASRLKSGPGRPRLGVVSREVSLLPRHWEWLENRPQGISAALRRLVDEARRRESQSDRIRLAREVAARFMTAMAGDRAGFEEAMRSLYRGERERFHDLVASWPFDVRAHLERLSSQAFEDQLGSETADQRGSSD